MLDNRHTELDILFILPLCIIRIYNRSLYPFKPVLFSILCLHVTLCCLSTCFFLLLLRWTGCQLDHITGCAASSSALETLQNWRKSCLRDPLLIAPREKEIMCIPFKCRESHLRLCARIIITSKTEHMLLLGLNTRWKRVTAEPLRLVSHSFYWLLYNYSSTGLITIEVWKAPPDCWPMSNLHQQFLKMPFTAFESCDHQWDSHSHVASPINRSNTPAMRSPIISNKSETAMEESWME